MYFFKKIQGTDYTSILCTEISFFVSRQKHFTSVEVINSVLMCFSSVFAIELICMRTLVNADGKILSNLKDGDVGGGLQSSTPPSNCQLSWSA